jgi:hypothetical protein
MDNPWTPVETPSQGNQSRTITELQMEIMQKDKDLLTLREQVRHLEELNKSQSEKIKFWIEVSEKQEIECNEAKAELTQLQQSALKLEGERDGVFECFNAIGKILTLTKEQ